LPRKPALSLAYDAANARPVRMRGCQRYPELWLPHAPLNGPGVVVGCRWRCDTCGLVGGPEWGPLRDLAGTVEMAEGRFHADFEGEVPCL